MPIQYTSYTRARDDLAELFGEYDPSLEGFVTTDVLPERTVTKKAANLSVLKRESKKRVNADHSNGAAFNRINFAMEDMSYTCASKGLEEQLTDEDRENYATDFDAEFETFQHVQLMTLIEQEIRTAALLFNTSTWTGAALYTDVSAAPWDTVGSGVIAQVLAAKEKVRKNTGVEPDSMLIGPVSLVNLLNNTGILARFPATTVLTEAILRSSLASIFGLPNLYVGKQTYDSAKEGQTYSGSDIWSDDYALIFKKQNGSLRSGGLGRTIIWSSMTPNNVVAEEYREEQTESTIIRAKQFVEEKVFDPYFGHLLKVDA